MKQDKQKHNWLIDAALFGGFLTALWLDLTGVAVHQWLGVAVGLIAGYHLWKHRSWVKAVTARLFGRTSRQSHVFYAVDAGLAVGLAAISVTGLVISTWLDLPLASYAVWRDVHVVASVATLALVVAKIGLHWRWILNVARRNVFPAPAHPAVAGQPAPVAAQVGRRDFVRLMGGVGAVALLAGFNAFKDPSGDAVAASAASVGTGALARATATPQGQATASTTARSAAATQAQTATSSASSTSGTCAVRCNKRCSYPGRCRKYTDSNKNGKCDLGECVA